MKLTMKALGLVIGFLLVAAGGFALAYHEPDRTVEQLKERWARQPSQFVEVAGMQVHLRDEGPRSDVLPIVLLHGTSASLHTWSGWADALKPAHRVIRFDLPAFGLTGPAPDEDYTIENYARVVVAVLDKVGVDRCVLGGNSLGGYIAWATALLHPDRVARLVLVDAAGYPFESQVVPIGFRIARTPVLNRLMETVLPRSLVEKSVRSVYGNPAKVSPELVDRYFELTTRVGNRKALVKRFRQTQPGELAQRVSEIKQPTLILWGGKDRLIPPSVGERFHREIAGSTLIEFPDLGHVPHEEDPARTVAAVEAFLAAPTADGDTDKPGPVDQPIN